MKNSRTRGERRGVRGQRSESARHSSFITHPSSFPTLSPLPSPLSSRAFTLVELLVTITIIGILAGLVLGALQVARESAREAATKSTIAKLNSIIMQRYESYLTRRVPLDLSTNLAGTKLTPFQIATDRLYAIRDIMRMEMPERQLDVFGYDATGKTATTGITSPITLPFSGRSVSVPAITQQYRNRLLNYTAGNGNAEDVSAELLYLIVSVGSPEALEQFSQSEIGDYDGNGLPEFFDGWGRPIAFLRWAPSFSAASTIQVANATSNHDPFDPRRVDPTAYQLLPLVYSAGSDGKLGIQKQTGTSATDPGYFFAKDASTQDMFLNTDFQAIGGATDKDGSFTDYVDNITNHHIEQR